MKGPEELIGRAFSHDTILDKLGRVQGEVYCARDTHLG
jgi:hypothetical protein